MPPIESWHVARWIALFESQITRRLPSTSSRVSLLLVPSRLSASRPSHWSRHFVLRGGASTSVNGSLPQAARQFATCLRSCDLLSSLRYLTFRILRQRRPDQPESVRCREIERSTKDRHRSCMENQSRYDSRQIDRCICTVEYIYPHYTLAIHISNARNN